MLGKHVK